MMAALRRSSSQPTQRTYTFGMARTEADVPLPSGPHKLCIQVADAAHMATDMTKIVPFTVS